MTELDNAVRCAISLIVLGGCWFFYILRADSDKQEEREL